MEKVQKKQEEKSLGMNTKSKYLLRPSRVPKKREESLPDSKKKKDSKNVFFCLSGTRYPKMSKDAVADACPFCRDNCNCKACFITGLLKKLGKTLNLEFSDDEKVQHSRYLLQTLLPCIKQFSQE
ncbi:hypothetical protein CRYUN_Cryun06bG0083200 [Craigia yunnanensis]